MKKVGLILVALLVLMSSLSSQDKVFAEKRADRFKGTSTIVPNGEGIRLIYNSTDKGKYRPFLIPSLEWKGELSFLAPVLISFVSYTEDWKYLDVRKIYCLVDGKPLGPFKCERIAEVLSGGSVNEMLVFNMDWNDFMKVCDAKKVEFKIGLTEFALSSNEKLVTRHVRDLILKEKK